MEGIRKTPVEWGTIPYDWSKNVYQCVWYVYFRCGEKSLPYPCWYDGHGNDGFGAYTNAKEWLKCYRTPWVAISIDEYPDYQPVANDIAVFDGEYGHVQFFETDTMVSEYSSGNANSFKFKKFERKSNLLGFLHLPIKMVEPVERNVNIDQIQTTDISLRIRKAPNLNAEIVGHVKIGYYNVYDKVDADGYTWYKLAEDRWCANITTTYLPANCDEDVLKEIEKYFNALKQQINTLSTENSSIKKDMSEIRKIADKWG